MYKELVSGLDKQIQWGTTWSCFDLKIFERFWNIIPCAGRYTLFLEAL